MYFQLELKTVWILIRWLRQKPSAVFLKKDNPGSAGQGLAHVITKIVKN